jgi:hypothetical protein
MATANQATRAAQMHAEDLSAYPNVVAVGTRRVDDVPSTKATKGSEAQHAVAVYVSRKVPGEQLGIEERLPSYVEVPGPGGTERVPVVVVESGVIQPEHDDASAARDQDYTSE